MKLLLILLVPFMALSCQDKPKKALPQRHGPHRPIRPVVPTTTTTLPPQASCVQKPIVIAVVDTGFGYAKLGKGAKLCKFGHKNFTKNQDTTDMFDTKDPVPVDHVDHGTNVVGLIDKYASQGTVDYCIVILKYYDPTSESEDNLANTIAAFKYATNIKADYINYSGGGTEYSENEKNAVENFIKQGGKFIAAAGNERMNLDLMENDYYPAEYHGVISVGNISKNGKTSKTSNYGKSVTRWEVGEYAEAYGIYATGTSQSTAIATGKLVAEEKSNCH